MLSLVAASAASIFPNEALARECIVGTAAGDAPTNADGGIWDRVGEFKWCRVDPISYHPHDDLANMVVKAWEKPNGFGKRMRTWIDTDENYPDDPSNGQLNRSMKRLNAFGIHVNKAVIVTEDQYYKKIWIRDMTDPDEVEKWRQTSVFVVPDRPDDIMDTAGNDTGKTARALMAAVPFGM
jgi:hypothetical protein